jgi:all-trans-retinol dehydrogenase (NAD+)
MLVNNAGIANGTAFLDTNVESMEMTFKVNVFAHFYLCKAFLPGMIEKRRGHIVF